MKVQFLEEQNLLKKLEKLEKKENIKELLFFKSIMNIMSERFNATEMYTDEWKKR